MSKRKYAVMVQWDEDNEEKKETVSRYERTRSIYECMFTSREESDAREYFYQLCATSGDFYSVGILRQNKLDDFPDRKTYDYDSFILWTRKKKN